MTLAIAGRLVSPEQNICASVDEEWTYICHRIIIWYENSENEQFVFIFHKCLEIVKTYTTLFTSLSRCCTEVFSHHQLRYT